VKGRLIDFATGYNRKQRITIELDSDFREGYEALKDVVVEVSVRKWSAKRSKNANAYFHVLVNQISISIGASDDEVKRDLIVQYGTLARDSDDQIVEFRLPPSVDVEAIYPYTRLYKQVEEAGKEFNCYLVYKHSSDMDSKEMAHLIDGAITVAQELGIDTDTPEAKARYQI
jgi:hypothetical protein